ncbi:DUF6402 family protein [Paracidovorax avenae]|uniref:DUF6402 family protein n=1 Tax=Paracidovorax avenae TaxID=80867 RepID=UPI000D212A24|nr:DUF6402 family protein [Paracidovorax avenae]AVS86106.1 hypothetical protein C8239_16225 [Paracidovorax avenae]AVS96819.1 hypothetical protein C8232_11580 [Paracidovorax avenae]AVT03925.1 hypothetical protein C8243_16535 [Paracidovorax avenae]AVT10838.1 hypothetical protein C8242_16105 [Paracidovorax avenae]
MDPIVQVDREKLRAELEKKLPPRVRRFRLDEIPGVMRSRLGWPVAAALMERWFRGVGFAISPSIKRSRPSDQLHQLPASQLEESVVTMGWALGFSRVRAAVSQLQARWNSPAGIEQIKNRVKQQTIGKTPPWRFGDLNQPAKILDDTCQVNFLNVGRFGDPLDDFYGALGEATLKIAVSGLVTPAGPRGSGKVSIAIDELAFYLRDSYDFNDDSFLSQPLGFWGPLGVKRSPRSAVDIPLDEQWIYADADDASRQSYLVQNRHFRQWRALHGRGGDFMVVSDVHRVRLAFPITQEW